jgi:phosphoglucosamine mutase
MKYFGTDGIRGPVPAFLTEALAYRLGRALSELPNLKMVIGRDTRESGSSLACAISNGAKSVGIDVCDIGVVSTPMLSFISAQLNAIGVMITASHNPYTDNGIKVFHRGKKLFASEEQALEDVLSGAKEPAEVSVKGIDLPMVDALGMYAQLFDGFITPTNLRIAFDTANGATYAIAPFIFKNIARNPVFTGNVPNGTNINASVGSTHLDHITAVVRDFGLEYGFAFDGDGDRLLVVDGTGRVFDGDQLIYVIATYLKRKRMLHEDTVVLTKMSNLGVIKAFERQQIKVLLTDVGDKYVLEALETGNLSLGGENSGHIINRYLLNTGDGILNSAYLIKIMEDTKMSLAKLTQDIVLYPENMINLKNVDKSLTTDPEVIAIVDAWKQKLGENGKIIVRASGTEPLIRVSVSASTQELVETCQQEIVQTIERLNKK